MHSRPEKSTLIRNSIQSGAGDATRTRDIFLGKEVLYQLSYTRVADRTNTIVDSGNFCNKFLHFLQKFLASTEQNSHCQ